MNIKEYVEKYGVWGLSDLLDKLLLAIPKEAETKEFLEIVDKLGENLGDLIYALGYDTGHMKEVRQRHINRLLKQL